MVKLFFEYLDHHSEAANTFNKAMTGFSKQEIEAILQAYPFSGAMKVVDVGGGHGHLIAAILQANVKAHGILFDQPAVLAGAQNFITEVGLQDRCALIAGNFFSAVPGAGDLYILKSVIHDWDDEAAIAILKNCHASMTKESHLILIERVVPSGPGPSEAKLFDINMLVVLGGCERTATQYNDLLKASGFRTTTLIATGSPLSVIEAVINR